MQLGVLLSSLEDETNAEAALDAIGDIVLYADVLETGARYDESPGQYVTAAVRRYASKASDEDWLGLMTAVEHGDNPGRVVLQRILRWAVVQDVDEATAAIGRTCSCDGSHNHH